MHDLLERRPKPRDGHVAFPGFADPEAQPDNQSFTDAVYAASNEAAGDDVMARPADAASRTAFDTVVRDRGEDNPPRSA
jgi:hypothetical protein